MANKGWHYEAESPKIPHTGDHGCLGEQLDIAPTNISSLLNNKTNWNRKTLERLMGALECDLADVLEVELDKESDPQ